ncbi:hypothetical protein [Boudabousia liubingyangii]|uniref:hypothetical protein n=1 Tax=Boudabousia liubingyangii TaxID=1921764 RepID=UPI000B221B32|nr:hypothetical protein [Boudabousia liubingyangii]
MKRLLFTSLATIALAFSAIPSANATTVTPTPSHLNRYGWVVAAKGISVQECAAMLITNRKSIDGYYIKAHKCGMYHNSYSYMVLMLDQPNDLEYDIPPAPKTTK